MFDEILSDKLDLSMYLLPLKNFRGNFNEPKIKISFPLNFNLDQLINEKDEFKKRINIEEKIREEKFNNEIPIEIEITKAKTLKKSHSLMKKIFIYKNKAFVVVLLDVSILVLII